VHDAVEKMGSFIKSCVHLNNQLQRLTALDRQLYVPTLCTALINQVVSHYDGVSSLVIYFLAVQEHLRTFLF